MLRDRGTKKWTAMMLTEHVELLRQHDIVYFKTPKPVLDDWELAQIEEDLNIAYQRKCLTEVTLWQDGYYKSHVGVIDKIDVAARQIILVGDKDKTRILVNDITKINCIN